jgi:hypothetical protein
MLYIGAVAVYCIDIQYDPSGPGTLLRRVSEPVLLVGSALILSWLALRAFRSRRWRLGMLAAGVFLVLVDLGGCTVRPTILAPVWGPLLLIAFGIFLLRAILGTRIEVRRTSTPGRPPLAAHLRRRASRGEVPAGGRERTGR